jgi:hypothetical protein
MTKPWSKEEFRREFFDSLVNILRLDLADVAEGTEACEQLLEHLDHLHGLCQGAIEGYYSNIGQLHLAFSTQRIEGDNEPGN